MSVTQYVVCAALIFVFGLMLEAGISAAVAALLGCGIVGVIVTKLSK